MTIDIPVITHCPRCQGMGYVRHSATRRPQVLSCARPMCPSDIEAETIRLARVGPRPASWTRTTCLMPWAEAREFCDQIVRIRLPRSKADI